MGTDIDGPLPDVTVKPGSTVAVDTLDAGALVTGLLVHGVTADGEPVDLELDVVPPYVYAEPT